MKFLHNLGITEDYIGHRERLRQRLIAGEGGVLADYEVLEICLFLAIPRRDVKGLAKRLIKRFGGLHRVFNASQEELLSVAGMGKISIGVLKLIQAVGLHLQKSSMKAKPIFECWQNVVDYCVVQNSGLNRELLRVIFLNIKNQVVEDEIMSYGTISGAPVIPREIARRAFELGAGSIILCHNHPSGDITPSIADIEATHNLQTMLKGLQLSIYDHIIVGNGNFYSMRKNGIITK